MARSVVDVLVVGAGPIGLILASALAHHGVRTRVVERRAELRQDSKANNLWYRPQELLAAIGALDALAADADADADEVRDVRVLLDGEPLDAVPARTSPVPTPASRRLSPRTAATGGAWKSDACVVLTSSGPTACRARWASSSASRSRSTRSRGGPRQTDAKLSWRRPLARDTI